MSEYDSLDAAWAEAEAALPDGWALDGMTLNSQRGQTKGQTWWASCHRDGGEPLPLTGHEGRGRRPQSRQIAYGPTPAAALRALAAKLAAATTANVADQPGDVRWCSTEDGTPGKGTGRHIACFVLRPITADITADIIRPGEHEQITDHAQAGHMDVVAPAALVDEVTSTG